MSKCFLISHLLIALILCGCRKDNSTGLIEATEQDLMTGSWQLNEVLFEGTTPNNNIYDDLWTFKENGVYEHYTAFSPPYTDYGSWQILQESPILIEIDFTITLYTYELLRLTTTEMSLRRDSPVSDAFWVYNFTRL